jgi:hypothetical protein
MRGNGRDDRYSQHKESDRCDKQHQQKVFHDGEGDTVPNPWAVVIKAYTANATHGTMMRPSGFPFPITLPFMAEVEIPLGIHAFVVGKIMRCGGDTRGNIVRARESDEV